MNIDVDIGIDADLDIDTLERETVLHDHCSLCSQISYFKHINAISASVFHDD